jgi:hypothetical protein
MSRSHPRASSTSTLTCTSAVARMIVGDARKQNGQNAQYRECCLLTSSDAWWIYTRINPGTYCGRLAICGVVRNTILRAGMASTNRSSDTAIWSGQRSGYHSACHERSPCRALGKVGDRRKQAGRRRPPCDQCISRSERRSCAVADVDRFVSRASLCPQEAGLQFRTRLRAYCEK